MSGFSAVLPDFKMPLHLQIHRDTDFQSTILSQVRIVWSYAAMIQNYYCHFTDEENYSHES